MRYRRPKTKIFINKPIVLVGMMGVGKTTIGRRLSRALGVKFTDLDQAIEDAAGMTVADIFESFGEEEFRAGEKRVMARLLTEKPQVIATGGGAFVQQETRDLIKDKAFSVWLDAPLPVLIERTGRRNTRPLLRGKNRADILSKLIERRRPFYSQATVQVTSDKAPHHNVVIRILEVLKEHFPHETPMKADNKTESKDTTKDPRQKDLAHPDQRHNHNAQY